jgi:hypothetical protein
MGDVRTPLVRDAAQFLEYAQQKLLEADAQSPSADRRARKLLGHVQTCGEVARGLVLAMERTAGQQAGPVCQTCNDTHLMRLYDIETGEDREAMCTHCPVPCAKCRQGGTGPFCATTPCGCECHKSAGPEPTAAEEDALRQRARPAAVPPAPHICPECGGTGRGRREDDQCEACHGAGQIEEAA